MGEGGRSRILLHVFLEIMPNTSGVLLLVRACPVQELQLPCTLRGGAPLHRSDGTCATGITATGLLTNAAASAGVTLNSDIAVEEVV